MIKKTFKAIGRVAKPFVNFPNWMGWKQIASDGKNVQALAKSFMALKKKRTPRVESFEEAKARLKLTEEALALRTKSFLQMAIIYSIFGVLLLAYTIYIIIAGSTFLGVFLGLALTFSAFAMSYREHLWYFQMKQRRLGCTFKDWSSFVLRRGK